MSEEQFPVHFPVVIVGAGPTGLSAAYFLARQGIKSLVVEKHPSTTFHPKARGLNVRTMELFRSGGLGNQIKMAGAALAKSRYMLFVESLAGKEIRRVPDDDLTAGGELLARYSPEDNCQCAQNELEQILLQAARSNGAEIRFNTRLLSFEQDATGVKATLRDETNGREYSITSQYLIAADGSQSVVRQKLGIEMQGLNKAATEGSGGPLGHFINIYFKLDLTALVENRWFGICFVENPQIDGLFLPVNNSDRWLLNVRYSPSKGDLPEDFTVERCRALISSAVGLTDLKPEILSILPWEGTARVAEKFQVGRVFLAGDAAHLMPPSGGFGLNTGVQDVHNLAWKMASVLNGQAKPDLLATYGPEREPVARTVVERAVMELEAASPDTLIAPPGTSDEIEVDGPGSEPQWGGLDSEFDPQELFLYQLAAVLGNRYNSAAIIEQQDSKTSENGLLDLSGRPGTRAPHLWLRKPGNNENISTLDLFEQKYVLLLDSKATTWREAFNEIITRTGIKLELFLIGEADKVDIKEPDLIDSDRSWPEKYGVTEGGAVLVRPDGFVAWRTTEASTLEEARLKLEQVLDTLLLAKNSF